MSAVVSGKQHFSPVTQKWEKCGASKRACRYGGDDKHRVVDLPSESVVSAVKVERVMTPVLPSKTVVSVGNRVDSAVSDADGKSLWRDVFAHLFGKKKVVKSQVDSLVVGELSVNGDGRIQVLSEDLTGEKGNLYLFGDFTSMEDAQALHDADRLKKFQNGDCGVLAGELWNLNPHVKEYYMFATDDDPTFGTHHFVQLSDGTYADSMGVWSEEAFVEYWKGIDPSVRRELFEEDGPEPERNPKFEVLNPEMFAVVSRVIENHFAVK